MRHEQIVRGVAYHQRLRGRDAEFIHQLVEHEGIGFAGRLVGRARGVKQMAQPCGVECLIKASAAFAGGHRQQMAAILQGAQHFMHAVEQGDVVLAFAVLLAKGLRQQGHAMCRHIRCHRLQRALQVQADDVARIIGARGRAAYFGHCRLEAAHNAACRVEQRSIPVENDEGVALGRKCGDRMVR